MFTARRQPIELAEPLQVRVDPRNPAFRDERDPDPLIEEMVQRLREGLRSLDAVDEWGRPLAWRNMLRMALGPEIGRLRDALTAATIATSMLPVSEDASAGAAPAIYEVLLAQSPPCGHQRAVSVNPFAAGELAGRGRTDGAPAPQAHGLLQGAYGEQEQPRL